MQWEDLLNALESFKADLVSLAECNASVGQLLERCDRVRDVDMVQLGVRLQEPHTEKTSEENAKAEQIKTYNNILYYYKIYNKVI